MELQNRLKRIEGQIRGLQKLVEEKKDCEMILQQISAVRSALYRVGILYVTDHINDCITNTKKMDLKPGEAISRFTDVLSRFA
ncbi:MAG: metal-sensitive transcriptional regulator [Firmicutes bacterium]|nr:metal-sensitive transcriptional regulator [Bacillota bacterium]